MDRVFTPDEKRLIRGSSDPDRVLWSLWAGKETGYKALRRRYPAVSSAPRRYEVRLSCTDDTVSESGTVHTPCGPVAIRFCITGDYVHCIGATADEEMDAIICDVRKIPRDQSLSDGESAFVREMAKRSVKWRNGAYRPAWANGRRPSRLFARRKTAVLPLRWYGSREEPPLSISA